MGVPELPSYPGEEELRPPVHVQRAAISSDDSENESADMYEGYQPLAAGDDCDQIDEPMNSEDTLQLSENDTETDVDNAEPPKSDLPPVESAEVEILRQVWNEPRPQELRMELDTTTTTQILNAMADFSLPNICVPEWAAGVPEERWKEELLQRIRQQQPTQNKQ